MTQSKERGSAINLDEAISLERVRALLDESDINQDEIAVLARLKARQMGLPRARKVHRSRVSMFIHGNLPQGHVFIAVRHAIQDYLGVEIDFDMDESNHD